MSRCKIDIVCWVIVLSLGIFLRLPPSLFSGDASPLRRIQFLHPEPKWTQLGLLGVDEGLYIGHVTDVTNHGLSSYPAIVEHYIELQGKLPNPILPPVRFLYIFSSYFWHLCFGTEARASLHAISSIFTMLTLGLSGIFAYRLTGRASAIAVTALMAFAPTQIHMSQHALIDGFFTFWALLSLWLLWENLRQPRDWRWLGAYVCALALLVLTKENSFFVWVALLMVMAVNRWLQLGKVTPELVVASVVGPILGVVVLIFLAGGLDNLLTTYRLLVGKASGAMYAILTGDGPWYRYLVDLFLVSPIVLVLALGTLFRLNRTMKPELFLSIFVAASYVVMCNVKYGMNLRYANMWDMPLRFLAFSQITALMQFSTRYKGMLIAVAVAIVAAIEFRQYYVLAVQYPLYELITQDLLRALHILKAAPQ